MNKIFRTVWNHHRRQIVVVNENTTSHSQATGSSETSSVERFSSKTKALVVSALASAVCACFALPAQASWITDQGGSDNRLDWIVGTEGTTTWNPLQNQEFEILQGETLNVGSTGSNHVEFSKYTLPNVTAGNRITNRGTYNIHWVGNKAQAGAENEGNFLDNYGKVNIVFDQTPNFGPDVSQANGNANHNISAWEIYKWNMDGSDATWLKDKPAFYNREGAEFTIDVNVDATKLTADQDPLKRDKTITGFAIDGENDRAHMVAKNAGKMGISIENAGAKTYGVWVNYDNSFVNEKTGVLEIVTSFKKPASNFLNLDEYSLGLALGGSGSFQNDGTVKVDVEGSRTITAINGAGSSPLTAKFVNSAGATMIGNATTNVGGTALVVGLGANDLFENYGTLTGTALANGGVAQAIGINNPESMINNYAGATLDLTAKSVYSPESSQKARAEGIYLNDGEKFLNHGNATLTAIVDGAGTANVMNGWGINTTDASKAGTTVSNDGTMVINYTGALGGGIKADSSQLENANQLTINVNRTDAEVIRTDVKGIYVARGGSLLNTKDLDVVITANVDSKENFDKKFQASGGGASGIFATATDATPVFTNKGHANVQVTLKNNVDGLSSGVRGNGVYLEGNGSNSGTLDIHLDANYGTVTKDFDVFAASGFWLNGDAKRYGTPRFENTGSLNINTNFVADGIQLVEMTGPNSKGWSRGLEIHGQGTFVNNGQLKSVSTGNVITEGLGVQGGEFINNKDAEFVATSDGQYALGALISMPTASFEQVPPTVTNVNGATLTLTATAKNGTSSALYQSAGTTTNAGTLLLNSTGKNARGIVLSNYETSLDQNLVPVLNNTGTLTITANSLEDGQPSSLHEVHGILLHKGEVNNSGTITTNVTGDGLVEGLKVTQTTFNNQLGGVLNINSVSNKDVYQDGMAAGVSIGANGNVVNAGELNIDMESHAHFIKGIAFLDRTSQLTNTGSISITGTNHGDGTTVVVPSLSDTKNAYGIYMNKSEQFANDGTVEIAVNSLKGVSMGIGVHDAEFTNNEHGNLNITTKAYEKQAYGIDVYGASGRSNNAGTITFDVTGGTTTSSHATGLFVRNGGFYGNTGTLDFNLHGVTSVDSNAEVLAIDLTRENTKFKNQGRIDITGRRTGDIATSGDLLGIRVNNGAVFENTDTGTISIDLGATGNHKYGNNFAVSVFNASTFGNKGTINITLDQEANNIGTLHGLMLGADAIVNNAASALIKIDVAPEDVASGHVWAINGEGASIRNYGTIETNGAIKVGSIVGSSASLDGGTVKLTGKDAVSTVATELKTGTLENAGTLTVGSKTSPSWAVNVYDLKNTGTLNADTAWFTNTFTNEGEVNISTTTNRIALSTLGKDKSTGEHVTILNKKDGVLNISTKPNESLTADSNHVAGIDLFSSGDLQTSVGGDFINLGTTNIDVESHKGHTYGIVADSSAGGKNSTIRNDGSLTIDVAKLSDDDTTSVRGIHTLSGVSIINNGTLTINASKQGNQRLYGVVLDGSETDRNTFHNTKDMTITLTENGLPTVDKIANEGLYGLHLSYTDAVNTGNLNLNLDGYRAEGIRVRHASTFLNQGAVNVSIKPKDSALLGDVAKQGNNYALQVIEGSTFKNDVNGTITYRYENDNAQLTTAFTDGLAISGEGSEFTNLGSIDIHLKDLGERQASKWMKGILVGSMGTLTNEGNIHLTSETNRATESIDGVIAVNGQLVNRGDMIVNATSHESDRQFLVGSGHLQNQKNLTLTLINDGSGNVAGFNHDWTNRTPDLQTLHVQNEKDMNLTLKALNGTATIFDMVGQERFDNGATGVITAGVSGGAGANGWSLADTSIFANDNEINLTLTGLSDSAKLAGLTMLGSEAVATNSGTMNITLAGQGAEAYGLKSTVADALFTNDGVLNIEATGTFTQASGMDWAGTVANAGEINSNVGLKIGTVTGTGTLTVTGGDVSVDQLNDQRQVILTNVGTANFGTIAMKSGSLEVNSKTTIANVTGNTSIKNLTNAGNLTLGGTLTLGANGAPGALNNTGTLTIKGHTTAVGSITNSGRFTAQDMDVQGSVYNRRTGVMQTGTLTVRGDKALTNEGEMTVADNSSVFGTLTNTGTIYLYDKSLVGEDGKIENRDELLVFGSLEVNGLLINLGTSKTQELILNGESISGTSGSFFMADRADVGAESIAQSGQVNGKRTNFGKDYWGTVTVNAVYENHDLIFAGSNDAILDQLGQGLSGTGMMIAAGGSILNQSGATLQINGALDNSGSVTGGTLALDASSQLTNRKTINVDALTGNDITFTQGETGATLTTAKNEVTNSNFILTQGNASFDTLGTGNTYQLGGHVGDSVTVDLGRLTSDSTVNIGQGAELAVTTIDLDGVKANTVVLDGGTIKTSLDQIFADVAVNGAVDIDAQSSKDTVNVSGMTVATNVGAIKDAVSTGIAFNSGTVAFTDRVFSLEVTNDVLAKLEADDGGNLEVAFNGKAAGVDAFTVDIANQITATKPNGGSTYAVFTGETLVNKDTTQPGLTHTQLVVGSVDPLGRYTPNKNAHHLTQSMGFKNVTGVTGGLYINDARFVLVGDAKQSIDLADGLVQVIGGEDGLVLGSYGSEVATKGHLAELNLGVFAEQGGYTVAGGATDVHNGDFVVDTLRLGGTLTVGDADRSDKGNAKLTIGSLTGYNGDVHNYGDTTITTIAVADNKSSMQIHNHGKLEIQNGTLEGRLENKVGAKVTTGDVTLAYTESVNDGTWLADTLTIAGSKKYIGDMIGRGELLNAGTLTVNKDLTLGSTLLSDDVASGGVLTNRSMLKNRPAKLTVNGTLTMDGKSVFVNDGRYASVTANALTMAAGSSFTNQKGGTVSVTEHGQIAGQYKNDATSSFGSLTVTQTGAVTNTRTLSVTGQTELAGSITGTGNVTTGNLTVDATGVLAMTGTGALTAQDVVVNAGGKVSVAGDSQLNALTATNAGELAFGSLAMTGDLSLTGSVMTALLSNAGNVTLDRSTLTSNHDVTLGSLTMTGSEATLGNATIAGNIDLTGGQLTTGTLTGEALTLRDQASLTAGNTHIASLNATTGTLSLGTLTVDGDITLDGSTVTAQLISGGNASLTNGSTFNGTGSNATLNSLSLASGSTMTVDRLGVTNAVNVAGVGSAFTGALTQGGVTTVTDGGQITSTGATNLESLTMKDAKDSTFGQLTVNGNVTLTGTNLKADLQSAGDVLINQGATIASTESSHLGTLTMTDAGASTMGDVTVDGAVSLTNTNLTANLVNGDATTLTGSTLISTGSSELASLTLDQNSNAQFGKLTVNGVLSVDGSILNAQIAHGGATTVSNGGQVQSTGSTTLDSLTMTDAEDSTFGTLTVKGDLTLAGTNLTADLLSANDVLIHQGATITSTGTSHLGSLTMTDAGTSSMGDVTVDGVVSLTNTNLTANLVKGGVTTLTGSQLTSTGVSDLASLTLSGASTASFGTLNVAGVLSVDGSVLNGQIAKAGATEVTNGGQITSTGVTTLDSLTMTDAKDSTFGTLTVNGDVALTGSKLTADLRQAANVTLTNATLTSNDQTIVETLSLAQGSNAQFGTLTVNGAMSVAGSVLKGQIAKAGATEVTKDGQIVSTGNTTLDSLTMTDAKDSSFGTLTVNGEVSLTNTNLIANLVKGGVTTLTGSQLTSSGKSDLASLALSGASSASFGTLNVAGALSVDGSVLNGQIANAGATEVTNGGQITSTGVTTLDSLTMTDAKDSTFGTLTVNGDVALTGSKLTADLRQAGNVTLTNGTLLSTGKTTMADYSQTGGVGRFGTVTANNVNVVDGAFTTAGLVAQSAAFAGKTSQVALNGTTHLGSLTITGTDVSTDVLTVTDKLVNDSLLTGSSLTAKGADDALVTVNNTGTMRFDSASGKVTYTQSEGEFDITKNNFTGSTFDVTGGIVRTDTLGKGNAWTLGGLMDSSVSMNINTLTSDSTVSIKDGATLETSIIALNGKANTVVLEGGTLSTVIDQIFTDVRKDEGIDIEAGKPGDIVDVEGLNAVVGVGAIKDSVSAGIAFNSGTVAFNDKVYSLTLATDVLNKLEADDGGNLEVVFNGRANVNQFTVDLANSIKATNDGKPAHAVFAGETLINIDKTQPDLHHSKLVVGSADPSVSDAHHLTQSMGFMNVTGVQDGLFIRGEGTEFVLVGVDANAQGVGDVHNFKLADGDVDVGTGSTLTLGSFGKALGTEGVLGLVTNEGTVNIKNGLFTLNELTGNGTLAVSDADHAKVAATLKVGTLTQHHVNNFGSIIAETMTVDTLANAGDVKATTLTLNGKGSTSSGKIEAKTATIADAASLTLTGSWVGDTLTVDGTLSMMDKAASMDVGTLTVNTNAQVTSAGTFNVDDLVVNGHLTQSGTATHKTVTVADLAELTNNGSLTTNTLTVEGTYAGSGALTVNTNTTVTGSLMSTGAKTNLGSLTMTDATLVAKDLTTSDATVSGQSAVTVDHWAAKDVSLEGVTTVNGAFTASELTTKGELTAGATTVTGAFVQTAGHATLSSLSSGTFESNGIVNVDKTFNTTTLTQKGGELTVGGALTVTAVTLDGVATVKGGLTAESLTTSNSLTAGITTLTGAFVQTAGNATLGSLSSGTFESNGIVNVDKTLNTTTLNQKGGELHVSGTLTATNATFNGTVESGDIHAQSVTTSGSLSASDATIEGIFDQTDGTVTLEDLTAGSVNQTTGQMTASNVNADKVMLGGKTDVAGLTAGQLTVTGTLDADTVTVTGKYDQSAGSAHIGTLTSESFANAGDVTVVVIDTALNNMGDLTINKTFELSGTNDGTLNADHAKGTLTDFTNNGMAQFGSTTVTDLTNNGSINFADATLNGVNVNNKDMTSDTLTVAGSLTSTGTLTSQKTTVNGTLSVNGGQAQLGELGVKGTLTTKGELTAGKTNLTGTLNVAQGGVANLGATTVNKGHVNVAGGKLQVESLTQKGGSLSLTQGGSFDGKLNITGADITLGNASLNADGSIKDSNLTITGGTWGDDLTNLVSTDKGALGNNTLTMTGGTLDLGDNTLTSSGSITMTGGTLIADNIALDGKTEGVITVGGKGTLQTTLNQIFKDFVVEGVEISATNWEDAWGGVHGQVIDAATDVGDVKDSIITGIQFEGGSLTFTDEAFRTDLVAEVGSALAQTFGDGKVNVEFTGHAVDDFTLDTIHKLEQDGMADKTQGLVFAGDDLINNSGDTTLDVGKADSDDIHMNTGFAGVTNTDHINIKDDLEFVLVGKTDKDGKPLKDQLLSDAANGGSVHVENGTLTLGSNGMKDKTGGTLAEVVLDEQGNLVIKNGDFTVDRIESDGTLHVMGGGSLTSNEVTLDKGDNKIDEGGVLIVEEDEKGNGSLHIKGEGTLTNDGTLIAGGDNSHVDTTVDGTLTNNGTGVYDDMTINPDGHYHNTSTGKDKGDKIEVAEGGKWTNDGQSNWGQVDVNGSLDNTGSIIIGDGKAETDDFHVGSNATVNQDGKLDASNAGHTIIEGNFTTGDLTEDGKLDPNAGTKFDDVTVTGGAHLENNGTEIGNNLTVDKDGEYVNNGQSQWGSVDMNGTLDNTGSIVIGDGKTETDDFHVGPDATVNQDGILDASNAGHTIIEGNFTTGDLTEDGKPDPNAGTKFDDVTVTGGAHLENNGTEIGNNLTVDKDGEYVNNGQSQWGTVDIAGKGENNGDLIIKGDGNDATGDLIIEGTGDLVNNGNLIVGGKDTNNDVIVDGTLTNNGTGVYDDMIINPDGHYNNTTTGKDQGDKIEVTEGGKWTNDGQSNWGQVDINGNASNNGDLIIGNGNDKDDDFHIGPNGSLDNQGHIDASNSGTAQIEGDLVNGTLSPDGKPDTDTSIKFDDVVVENGGKLENNGTESGDSLVVKPGGDYINNGNSNWNDVTIEDGANGSNNGKLDIENDFVVDGDFNNNGSINAGNTIIGGNFDQTDNGSLNTGDLTVRPGGNIDMDKGEINVSGDLNLNGANVVIGNWKALSQENRVSPTWSADKPIDGKIWVIGNGDLTFGTASKGFADKLQKFDKKVPGLSGAASRVTVGQTVTMGAGSSLAVGSNVWNPAKDQGRVELTEGSVYFGRDSYVLIDIGALGDGPAFTTTVEGATATVESGANLVFGNLSKTGEFTLLEGFEIEGNFDKDGNWTGGWDGEDMYIVNEDGSGLDYFITINVDKDKDRVNANVAVADIATVYPNIVLPGLGNEALKDCQSGKDSSFICSIVKNENLTVAEKTQIINSVAQIASVAGTTASAFADMGMATDVLESRLSFTGPTHKNGQLLQIPATDALWVEVIGGKSRTTSLNYTKLSGGYKSDTYGFMIGADALMPKPAVKLGGAFSYLSGSLKSVGGGLETSNSYDTYGAHLYAAWTPTTKFNLIGHMDWMHQESDVNMTIGQSGFNSASAKPKVNVAQVGVRAEVRETAGLFEIVPHVGVRGVYTKTENFKTKLDGKSAFGNELEDTFTVQLPIGLSVSGNIPANTGWTVSPKADVTFVGQVGDTEQKTVVSGTSMSASDTVTGAFAGECYGQFKLGLSVINPKADTSFGGTVGYTRGDAGKKDLSFGVQFTKNF